MPWLRPYVSTCLQVSRFFPHYSLPTTFHWDFRHLSLCKFGTASILTKCSLADTQNICEPMRSDATLACRHWLVIWYTTVVISEIIDFEVSPCIFLFYTLWTIFHTCVCVCVCIRGCAHTFAQPPPSLGVVGSYFGTPRIPGKKITSF